jgi:phosphoglycerate dehydrogenase-like enzyme
MSMLRALVPPMLAGVSTDVPLTVYQDFTALGDVPRDQIGFVVPPYMGPAAELAVLTEFPQLQVVQLLTAGYDHARPLIPAGVLLCNAAGVHDASTAELALGLIIASQRGIDDFARAMPDAHWLHAARPSLADRRVLIIGAGGLGTAIRERLKPFEVELRTVARTERDGVWSTTALPELLPWAEIVILAVPLSDETNGMVDAAFLAQMADGALLVNMSRGPVVDTDALTDQVATGRLRAALDVTDPEPLPNAHPLWRLPGVLISPHVGGNSSAFVPRAQRLVTEQLSRWASGAPLRNVVNR